MTSAELLLHPPHPKKKYYATQHTITSSLELQKP
ncbi:hypothetical protein LMG22037_05467 [Paraburkholderia phenoliruptrix]|uniref:Uncharacterized protein n=1 Tax=Paraburkholderia phenoliruptrix TaxID=252970 RepID=A0A6J5CAK4_9BURK|nr:hypothetical protein LMG22037_05467 [Paraburkholderia phenoliruptrix]